MIRYGMLLKRLQGDPKARELLAWVALASRPLKVHELLDGVCLARAPFILDRTTKLFQAEIHRCEPLLEIDVNGNVDFVHLSAKE
jgi:hypothetical protein